MKFLHMKNTKIKILLAGVVLLVFANFFVWKEVFGLGGNLELVFFDVGQGDSIFIETPQGHQVLIDGGPSGEGILEKLSGVMPFWDRSLDLVVLTHPDYDHLRGLLDVLDRYEVENILWTGAVKETNTFEKWLEELEAENSDVFIAERGQVIKASSALFYIFHPFENLEGVSAENNSNETSVVAKLVFGENSFLLTGDIMREQEQDLLARSDSAVSLAADILKVPHHGSKNSGYKGLAEVLEPEIAVISCGKDNKYGHPHPEVLSNLEKFDIKVLRTDEKGDIKIVSDGNNFKIINN